MSADTGSLVLKRLVATPGEWQSLVPSLPRASLILIELSSYLELQSSEVQERFFSSLARAASSVVLVREQLTQAHPSEELDLEQARAVLAHALVGTRRLVDLTPLKAQTLEQKAELVGFFINENAPSVLHVTQHWPLHSMHNTPPLTLEDWQCCEQQLALGSPREGTGVFEAHELYSSTARMFAERLLLHVMSQQSQSNAVDCTVISMETCSPPGFPAPPKHLFVRQRHPVRESDVTHGPTAVRCAVEAASSLVDVALSMIPCSSLPLHNLLVTEETEGYPTPAGEEAVGAPAEEAAPESCDGSLKLEVGPVLHCFELGEDSVLLSIALCAVCARHAQLLLATYTDGAHWRALEELGARAGSSFNVGWLISAAVRHSNLSIGVSLIEHIVSTLPRRPPAFQLAVELHGHKTSIERVCCLWDTRNQLLRGHVVTADANAAVFLHEDDVFS